MRFKIGDRVKLDETAVSHDIGELGTVVGIHGAGDIAEISLDNGSRCNYYFTRLILQEPVVPEPKDSTVLDWLEKART